MLKFVAVALLVTVCVFSVWGEQCCAPKQWESFVGIENTTAVDGKIEVRQISGIESYDYDRKMIAVVIPGHFVIKVIQDYNKGMMYTIVAGQCYATPWPYPMVNCIPDNATMIEKFEIGGPNGLMIEQYQLQDFIPGFNGYIQFTRPGCIPVSQTQYYDSYVTTYGFTNITAGIKDPSVFDIPSPPCPMDVDNVVKPLLFKPVHP
ncbi:mammalian ependymin-related protein 1-like isoform X1 [Branchiostoma floridae x Branchiostoma japonicum]